jgi:hypothetical protein
MTFWNDLAVYCHHLAPCATPAVATVGRVAGAISTAERQVAALHAETLHWEEVSASFNQTPLLPEDEFCG